MDRLEGKKLQGFNLKPSQSSKLTYFNNFLHHSNKPEAVLECVGWGGKAAQKGTRLIVNNFKDYRQLMEWWEQDYILHLRGHQQIIFK